MRAGLDLRRVEAVVLTGAPDKLSGHRNTGEGQQQHSPIQLYIIRRTLYSVYMHSRAESDIYMCEPAPRSGAATLCLSCLS